MKEDQDSANSNWEKEKMMNSKLFKRRKYPELKGIKLQIKEFKYAQNNEHGKDYTYTQGKKKQSGKILVYIVLYYSLASGNVSYSDIH